METNGTMGLNIYFSGSICGGRNDAQIYAMVINHLKKYGRVLTEIVGDPDVMEKETAIQADNEQKSVHDQYTELLNIADVVVAEVTQPSHGVGYEIGRAVTLQKPILCLFCTNSGKNLSCMLQGAHDGNDFVVKRYEEPAEAVQMIDKYMERFTQ